MDRYTTRLALSEAQLEIWSGLRLFPQPGLHDLTVAFELSGIDPGEFQESLRTVVDSEPLLRARLLELKGGPVLTIDRAARATAGAHPSTACSFALRDLRGLNAEERDGAIAAEAQVPLNPAELLFRSVLFRLDDARSLWLITVHHLIADGWSIKLLVDRVSANLSPDFAARERPTVTAGHGRPEAIGRAGRAISRKKRRSDEAYWSRRLAAQRVPLDLYGTRPASLPGVERVERKLCEETTRMLRWAAESCGGRSSEIALSNLMTAALAIFLHRLSGNTEVSIGMPFANRHDEAERARFGLFMRIGVVRLTIDPAEKIDALVRRVAEETSEASRHLAWTPSNTRNRFFEAMLNYHNVRYPAIGSRPVVERWLHSANDTLPLTVHLRTSPPEGTLLIQLDLQRHRFASEIREDAMRQFLHVLDQVGRRPDLRVSEVELEEKDRLVKLYARINSTRRTLPLKSIETLFRLRAEERDGCPAVYDEGGAAASFAQLDERSEQIARRLWDFGARRGDAVAAYLPRSTRAVVALLATLKAGCIWVPLDPSNPPARVFFMLRDSGARVLLSDEQLAAQIDTEASGESSMPPLILVNEAGLPVKEEGLSGDERTCGPGHAPTGAADAGVDLPAYCLYTSGSTGVPKGVVGTQGTILNRLSWMWRTTPLEPDEVLLHKTSISFIDSLWEILGALLAGHPVAIASDAEIRDPSALALLLARFPIRRIVLVPSLLTLLVEEADRNPGLLDGLKHWFVTGELLHSGMISRLRSLLPRAEIYNLYGTSETFDAACYRVGPVLPDGEYLPIGAPIDNTRLYVVDQAMNPLPPGVRGELLIAGSHIPAEYLHRPELSQARFLPRFSFDREITASGAARFFRTGDLARLRSDGSFECLGRRDGQHKVRGFRIEIEEVERTLQKHPGVERSAVVILDGAGDERIAAFVRLRSGASIGPLRVYLREQLPSWMIPELHPLEKLPLTPSGKVDRLRLTEIAPRCDEGATAGDIPLNGGGRERHFPGMSPEERQLAALWRRLLRLPQVLADDDFFELGGTSLLAVRLIAEVERLFGKRLPLTALFEASTVRSFARAHLAHPDEAGVLPAARGKRGRPARRGGPTRIAEAALSVSGPRSRTALRAAVEPALREAGGGGPPGPSRGSAGRLPLFSVPPAGSTVSAFAGLARLLRCDQSLYSFQPLGVEAGEKPLRSIPELAKEYLSQIRAVQRHGPYLLIGRCFGGYVAYEMAQRLLHEGERIGALIIVDSREAPLDRDGERLHTGIRKLYSYYPARISYFLRRRRLTYALRMKARNEIRYQLARISCLFAASGKRAREHRLRLLRHLHTLAYHRYVAQAIDCPITMIWAGASPDLTGEREKWMSLARKGIEWHTIDCDHHDLMKGRNLEKVAEVVAACAARVGATDNPG